ncbi:MAG: hypothetical protein PHH11_10890, partial [Methylomonas sp.]|nr:hypothetical protein [Methylomonas sp.]
MTQAIIETVSSFEIQEINQETAFLSLRAEWNELLSESDSDMLFLRHEWLSCWWLHFAQSGVPNALLVLVLRSETGELCGIAPFKLARHNLFGIRLNVIGFLGEGASDYADLIFSRSADHQLMATAICNYLHQQAARWDVIDLRNLYADTQTRALLLQEVQRRGWRAAANDEGFCRYIPIQGQWEAYYSERVSSAGRSAHRKEWRRLNTLRPSEVRIIRSVADLHGFLEQLAEVESLHP